MQRSLKPLETSVPQAGLQKLVAKNGGAGGLALLGLLVVLAVLAVGVLGVLGMLATGNSGGA